MTVKSHNSPGTLLRKSLIALGIILAGLPFNGFGSTLSSPTNFAQYANEPPTLLFSLDTSFTEDSQLYLSHDTILKAVYDPDHDDSLLTITITADSGLVFYWFDQVSNSHKFWANKDVDSCGYFHIRVQDPLDSVLTAPFVVDIIPVNDPPVIEGIPDTSTVQDSAFYLPLNSYWSDVDNNLSDMTWSVSAVYSDVSVTDTKDSLVCTPPPGFIGWDTLFLMLTDLDGLADRDTFRLYFRDALPPAFTIGVFQNPVASEHLDIYFFPDESIDSLFSAVVNYDSLSAELLTGINPSPFHAHYRLQNSGVQQLRITAADTSGNIGTTEYDFSSSFISKMNGGIIYSPDSLVQLTIAREVFPGDDYLLCLPKTENFPAANEYVSPAILKKTSAVNSICYSFISSQRALTKKCKLTFFRQDNNQQWGVFEWKQQNWVYLQTYTDPPNTRYWTYIDHLGIFMLKPNTSATAACLPDRFSVAQNYPNPFNSETVISFTLPELNVTGQNADLRITIYDIRGRQVDTIIRKSRPAGRYSLHWNGTRFAGGIYFYTIHWGRFAETKKMVLLK